MPKVAVVFGLLLIGVGLFGQYFLASRSVSALIPAIPGTLLLLLGVLPLIHRSLTKYCMHTAAMISLLGSLILFMAIPKIPELIRGTALRPNAIIMQLMMGSLCLIFLVLCIRSFRRARKSNSSG